MKPGRALVLLSLCFLDLHVRADDRTLEAETSRHTYKLSRARVVMQKGSLAVDDGASLRLIKGTVFVTGGTEIKTPYARFSCEGACEAIFVREDDSISIEALSDGWSLVRLGEAREYAVSVATRVVVGTVARDGRAAIAPSQSLPWMTLIRRWAQLWVDGPERFADRVHEFRPIWDQAVLRLSVENQSRSVAMLETHQAELDRQAARARAEAAEDARLRALFRERNFVE